MMMLNIAELNYMFEKFTRKKCSDNYVIFSKLSSTYMVGLFVYSLNRKYNSHSYLCNNLNLFSTLLCDIFMYEYIQIMLDNTYNVKQCC